MHLRTAGHTPNPPTHTHTHKTNKLIKTNKTDTKYKLATTTKIKNLNVKQ
jgi:hypothetical protein